MRATVLLAALLGCDVAAPGTLPPADPALEQRNREAGDPYGGRFPLAQALAGLPEQGELRAIIVTEDGELPCTLDPGHAPLNVANFVGLARGLRPFRDADAAWVRRPFYDGSSFHRVVPGQFVQGGRAGNSEDAGFAIQSEVSPGDAFDRAGVLAMANAGPDTAGTQFFVTTGDARHLRGHHTVLGTCEGAAVARAIARRVETAGSAAIRAVRIERR